MTTDKTTVDVLSVLDQAIQREKDSGQPYISQTVARAAVDELLAATDDVLRLLDWSHAAWDRLREARNNIGAST